ncbi:hypothetical protein [uncultured Desulfobacter sp.]|jgi:hypothetical protein|nr:hypothetical protein [uncultured Desulfobacter sp.]
MEGLSDQRGRRCRKIDAAAVSLPKRFLREGLDSARRDKLCKAGWIQI